MPDCYLSARVWALLFDEEAAFDFLRTREANAQHGLFGSRDSFFVKLEAVVGDALFKDLTADLMRRLLVVADNADRGPRAVPRRQLPAAGITRECMKLAITLRLEHEKAHGLSSG
jgi:hypothetical protein